MYPHPNEVGHEESGIKRVVEAYAKWLPKFGVTLVDPGQPYDLSAVHAGSAKGPIGVAHTHGLYWTADYVGANWEWAGNYQVVDNVRRAQVVTVPSEWVAETFRRDMHLDPVVLGHGIDLDDWGEPAEPRGYVLWNKNRTGDVCSPQPVNELASRRPDLTFVTTFVLNTAPNIKVTGKLDFPTMRDTVKRASVYLATTKETFGIGTLEAMASGVPVLGFRHGGILDMVEHGVNGYLAEPGNWDDLNAGLTYCLQNAKTLGANGIEVARRFTWEKAVERVAGVYALALEGVRQKPSVGVVIPSFKYADKVGRAIQSVLAQTLPASHVIVVDDGTPDDGATARAVAEYPGVLYVRQDNAGVAIARNHGISILRTKYACCLDADDAIEPLFLERCVAALEKDRSMGIAYTGLLAVMPDGTEKVSEWPGKWDYDQQLRRRNQVPTCCVFRRAMWERLGGYRQRYAPKGAGAEDGEFWLRAGAIGFRAEKVTEEPLFRYSFLTGQVSGDKAYREVDWLAWHPWAGSPRRADHPFASFAHVEKWSHPVRAYDEPAVSIIIPVGRGHEGLLLDALDSLEAQTFPRWEVIVVDDSGELVRDSYATAFPFVRWYTTPGHAYGAGYARNLGASHARAPLLLFLDADDWLYPQALEQMLAAWNERGEIVYTDYVGKAHVEDRAGLAPDLQKRVYAWDESTKQAVMGFRSAEYDCERACRQPEGGEPYLWCNVTCLIPKAWHDGIGGFDEKLKTWEDVDYHWRMARAGRCYVRLPVELMVYRFGTGFRRQLGLQTFAAVVEYIRHKYEGQTIMGCGCKGGNAQVQKVQASAPLVLQSSTQEAMQDMADNDVVLARYLHPNRGQHKVVGVSTRTVYGYRAGGDTFLVHKADIAAQPHLYAQVQKAQVVAVPSGPPAPPAPPLPIEVPVPKPVSTFDPQSIPGVGPDMVKQLTARGILTLAQFKAMSKVQWTNIKGVGEKRADAIMAALKEMA